LHKIEHICTFGWCDSLIATVNQSSQWLGGGARRVTGAAPKGRDWMQRLNLCGGVGSLAVALAVATTAQAGGTKDYGYESGYEPVVSPKSTVTFSGSDWSKDASYFYSGVIFALNRDLGRDG